MSAGEHDDMAWIEPGQDQEQINAEIESGLAELDRRWQELRKLGAADSHVADLAATRARRRELQLSIDRHGRALEEALRTLAPAQPDKRRPAADPSAPPPASPTPTPRRADNSNAALNNHREEQAHAHP